jgi:hypothetical protein
VVDGLLSLCPPRPARKVPRLLRRLLPNPLRSIEEWVRFTHADLVQMAPAARRAEAFRIRVAVSLVEHSEDDVPDWLLDRIARLEAV